MAEPGSLTQQLIQRIADPFTPAMLIAVACTSFMFFGALEMALDGILPATITKAEREKKDMSDASVLKLWEWVAPRAKVSFLRLFATSPAHFLHRGNALVLPLF